MLGIFGLGFGLAASAVAIAPQKSSDVFQISGLVLANCRGFRVILDATIQVDTTTFFDESGNAVAISVHVQWRGTATNSKTGDALVDKANYIISSDLTEGTTAFLGVVYRWVIEGYGIVVLDAGKLVFTADGVVFDSTPEVENGNEYCEAFRVLAAA